MAESSKFHWRAAVMLPLVFGCAAETRSGAPELVQEGCSRIVGGGSDRSHRGVVALLNEDGALACSGSLIGNAGGPVVLTAAHCLRSPLAGAVIGSDYAAPDVFLPALSQFAHPDFDRRTGDFDFGVVVLDGVTEASSWLSLPSGSDDLGAGTPVEFVGYGSTEDVNPNTERREVAGTIEQLTPTSFEYAQTEGGPCSGDSGGPALAELAGKSVLVGVTSSGDESCRVSGVSARVSAATDFIAAVLGGDAPSSGASQTDGVAAACDGD